jgi:hypothetical protein
MQFNVYAACNCFRNNRLFGNKANYLPQKEKMIKKIIYKFNQWRTMPKNWFYSPWNEKFTEFDGGRNYWTVEPNGKWRNYLTLNNDELLRRY